MVQSPFSCYSGNVQVSLPNSSRTYKNMHVWLNPHVCFASYAASPTSTATYHNRLNHRLKLFSVASVMIFLIIASDDSVAIANSMERPYLSPLPSQGQRSWLPHLADQQGLRIWLLWQPFGDYLFHCDFISFVGQHANLKVWSKSVPCVKCLWNVVKHGFYVQDSIGGQFMHPWSWSESFNEQI